MPKRIGLLLSLAVLLGGAGQTWRVLHAPGFHLKAPAGFSVTSRRGPDFDVYRVGTHSKTILGVYSGFAPSFPADEHARVITRGQIKIALANQHGREEEVEWLIPRPQGFLHVWAMRESPEDLALAKEIAATVTPD